MDDIRVLVAMPRGAVRDSFMPPELQLNARWNDMDRQFTPEELSRALEDIQLCVTGWGCPRLTREVIQNARALRAVAHTGGTVASLVSDELYARGVKVLSGNEIYARSVAEGTIAYMLASLRDIPKYACMVKRDGWSESNWYTQGLLGQRVGLVGFGAVARHTVGMLRAFDAEILVASSHLTREEAEAHGCKKATIEEIFSSCKIVSLHMAATEDTYHAVDGRLLNMLMDGALIINTARGSVIDERALAEALASRPIKAVLDVYEREPLPMDSPLRGLPNAILLPHMGGPTMDRRPFVTKAVLNEAFRLIREGGESYLEIDRRAAARMTR